MENKGIVIFLVCVVFGFMGIMRWLQKSWSWRSWREEEEEEKEGGVEEEARKFCSDTSSWFYLFLASIITIIILSL